MALSHQLFDYLYSYPGKCGSWGTCLSWCLMSFTRVVSWLLFWAILSDHCIHSAVDTVLPDPEIWPWGFLNRKSKCRKSTRSTDRPRYSTVFVDHCHSRPLQSLPIFIVGSLQIQEALLTGVFDSYLWRKWVFLSNLNGLLYSGFSAVGFILRDWYLYLDASRKWMQSSDV